MEKRKQRFDSFRKTWVEETPEETVRQNLLYKMVDRLGYPKNLITLEKQLSQLPFVEKTAPNRRLDILCYGKKKNQERDLVPLILIECKAVSLNEKMLRQVIGYNHYVKAPFMAVVNEEKIMVGWHEQGGLKWISFLPSYHDLLQALPE